MTTTKNENLAQEKKGDKMKRYSESEEKEEEVKPSKKKEQQHNHPVSESPLRSITYKASKHPSAPTLQDSFNKSHSHHSMSDGDLQIVVASHSHSHSHSQSVSEGTINVVKEETKAVMDKEEGTHDDGVSKKESKWFIVLMGLRITAFLFCKLAFSVLASDHRKKVRPVSSWYDYDEESSSQLHWYDFKEFKYCLSVNIIGFVYSALQLCDMVKYLITKRHTVDPKLRGYFNFAMDQVLAYILMSASSTAATAASYWTNSYLVDKYVEMANASVALSFVAFVAFASSSIVSAFIFCRFN